MPGQRYRLKTPTLAILEQDGQKLPLTVPMNATVCVLDGLPVGTQLVNVEWEAKRVLMFTIDLRDRGELIEGAGA